MLSCEPAADWRDAVPDDYLDAFESAAARYELGRERRLGAGRGRPARVELRPRDGQGDSCAERGPLGLDATEWSTYAVDGDEDGHIRHADPADSAATLARMIWSRGSLRAGIFTHNQAQWYVQAVLAEAEQIEGELQGDHGRLARSRCPAPTGAPINWDNLTLSNELELRDLTTGAIDPRIVGLIGAITQEHQLTLSALRSDHSEYTASGNVSNHFFGRAMDIAAVDGVSCTDTSVDAPCGEPRPHARPAAGAGAPHRADLLLRRRRPGPGLRAAGPLRSRPRRLRRLRQRGILGEPASLTSSPRDPRLLSRGPYDVGSWSLREEVDRAHLRDAHQPDRRRRPDAEEQPGRVAEVNKEVEQIGAKVVAQYATLGQYDFVTIVEAPDEQTMAKVSVELGSRGTMTSQTLTAIPAEDLADSL